MKKLVKAAAAASAVLLLFALLAGALYRIFTDHEWVEKEYERIGIEAQSGYPAETASFVLGSMMDYSTGKFDDLDKVAVKEDGEYELFFNESELAHMKDVRRLTLTVLRLGLAALIAGAALFLFVLLAWSRGFEGGFAKAFLIALGVLILIIAALGIWMAIDFDSFWSAFHVVFLDLESSTFDPAVSRMIRICPAELFSDFIIHFALISGLGLILPVASCVLYLCFRKKNYAERKDTLAIALCSVSLLLFLAGLLTGIRLFTTIGWAPLLAGNILNLIFINRKQREKPKEE